MLEQSIIAGLDLQPDDIRQLQDIEATMQYYADLIGADIFLDCFTADRQRSVVVAEARPRFLLSNYSASVLGQEALPQNEPAVFAALRLEIPVWDIMAVTQEHKTVRQDVVPLKNAAARVFGVLICERDVSADVRQQQKYEELVQTLESVSRQPLAEPAADKMISYDYLEMREIHHRVKNNLQMVASILNIQARRSSQPEVKAIFRENVNRILSIADIYDILIHNRGADQISLLEVIERIKRHVEISIVQPDQNITIEVTGDDVKLASELATMVAVVVNELLANSIQHAFAGRTNGHIKVAVRQGNRLTVIMVEDDGIGYDPEEKRDGSLGLELVRLTVKERLGGSVYVTSGSGGTKFSFEFLTA